LDFIAFLLTIYPAKLISGRSFAASAGDVGGLF